MVPVQYLAQFVLGMCLLCTRRIVLVPLQHFMDATVEFVEPC